MRTTATPGLRWAHASVWATWVLLTYQPARAADFERTDPPSWVTPHSPSFLPAPELEATSHFGLVELLADDQLNLSGPLPEHYRHHVRRLLSKEGVAEGSELSFEVDPSYETLALHAVRIWRDGKAWDALKTATIRSFFREQAADDRIYDGRKTIVIALHDVRANDTIDYEATITGKNPVFGAHFDDFLPLTQGLGVAARFVRIIPAPGRPLHVQPQWLPANAALEQALLESRQGNFELELHDLNPAPEEDDTPAWYDPTPGLHVSDYQSWADVSSWALSLTPTAEAPSAELETQISALSQTSPDRAVQALAAVRFVQDEVRYLGFELGAYSHQPRPAEEVLRSRFGDCKDKSGLLVALLRGLGFEAHPALVNVDLGAHVAELPPGAGAFNHAVVALRHAERWQFIDATRSASGGKLDTITPADFGKALVLAPGVGDALLDMPSETLAQPYLDVVKTITVAPSGGGAEMLVTRTYRGAAADAMRSDMARSQPAEFARHLLNNYAASEPSIELTQAPTVNDDRDANVIDVQLGFRIADFVRDEAVFINAAELREAFDDPAIRLRSTPLAMPHPENLRVSVALLGNSRNDNAPPAVNITSQAFSFRRETDDQRRHGGPLKLTFELRTHQDHVPATGIAKHLRASNEAWHEASLFVPWSTSGKDNQGLPPRYAVYALAGFIGLALATAVGYERHARRRRSSSPERPLVATGDAPASAIATESDEGARGLVATRGCQQCGCTLQSAVEIVWTDARYAGYRLACARAHCGCGHVMQLYFRVTSSN